MVSTPQELGVHREILGFAANFIKEFIVNGVWSSFSEVKLISGAPTFLNFAKKSARSLQLFQTLFL